MAGALKGHISIITGHIFTKLAWMKHFMIQMRLTRLNYESEPYVLILMLEDVKVYGANTGLLEQELFDGHI